MVPCRAGILNAVVYSNGDVSVCEAHTPLGNLREKTFNEIWSSPEAQALRTSIANRECTCTNEVFLWPSIVYQPYQLMRGMIGGRVWRKVKPLSAGASSQPGSNALPSTHDLDMLVQITAQDGKR